jgi:2,4-dienoyl-CoA reductase-like NADH-dependent reductase (Old Yellow Enzyme family)
MNIPESPQTNPLTSPLVLPCGATLANRLCKAAMSEGLADANNNVTPRLTALYSRWAQSGAGLLLSGNVQVDRWHLERPGNVVLDRETDLGGLAALARAGRLGGAHFWLQLSHTGRQVSREINSAPLAPSCVEIDVPRGAGYTFAPPREMTEADIEKVIEQFAFAARQTRAAGFTGVQLHAAHGYLLSQFLSPLSNRRTDRWGGPLENRARLLFDVIAAVRSAVGSDFPIGIKLNSSDFQKGGFTNSESVELTLLLNDTSLDLLELSGGSLEQPKLVGVALKDEGEDRPRESTIRREAYFVEFAGAVRAVARMPVMVTGNFRTRAGMVAAMENGDLDMIGLGRPLIADSLTPARLLTGEIDCAPTPERSLNVFHLLPWFNVQLEGLADGLEPDLALGGPEASEEFMRIEARNIEALLAARSAQGITR